MNQVLKNIAKLNINMQTDILNLDDATKQSLHISYIGESSIVFKRRFKTVELMKYNNDGAISFEIEEGGDRIEYIFEKDQIDALITWINHK